MYANIPAMMSPETVKRRRDYGEGHICSSSFFEQTSDEKNDAADDDASTDNVDVDGQKSGVIDDAIEGSHEDGILSSTDKSDANPNVSNSLESSGNDGDTNCSFRDETTHCVQRESQSSSDGPNNSWPVALYIPNLLGYLRIFLSFYGLKNAIQQKPDSALNMWVAAALLDLIDGIAARKLNQCSQFGILLDVAADNVLRSTVWISAILESLKNDPSMANEACAALSIICLEWITMFCSQSSQTVKKKGGMRVHWKDMHKETPFWVRAVFKNNFKTVPGIFAIFGLFVSPFGTYIWYADRLNVTWPSRLLSEDDLSILIQISYVGRLLSAMVEMWICYDYLGYVIANDAQETTKLKCP